MLKWFFTKFLVIPVMVFAPGISGRAFYEYFQVAVLHHVPSYPFGKEVTDVLQHAPVEHLHSYEQEMLTIGIVCLAITVLVYVCMLIKTLSRFAIIGVIAFAGYLLYMQLGK